jgi:hypothetical protein
VTGDDEDYTDGNDDVDDDDKEEEEINEEYGRSPVKPLHSTLFVVL